MKREDLKLGLRVRVDSDSAFGGVSELKPLLGSTGTIVVDSGSDDGIPFVQIDSWPIGFAKDFISESVSGKENTTALYAMGLSEVKEKSSCGKGISMVFNDYKSDYTLSEEEVIKLSSHSKTARRFFGKKFPGVTLRRFYPGTKYRYIGPDNVGWKPGTYLLTSFYKGLALFHQGSGHAHTEFIQTLGGPFPDESQVKYDDLGGVVFVTRKWVFINDLFGDLSWWQKIN
jgi:hypothetical protein